MDNMEMARIILAKGTSFLEKEQAFAYLKKKKIFNESANISAAQKYLPVWIGLVTAYANREPFRPKKHIYPVYIDALNGECFLLKKTPVLTPIKVFRQAIIKPLVTKKQAKDKIEDLKKVQIRNLYILRKPKLFELDLKLIFRPVLLVKNEDRFFWLNQLTSKIEDMPNMPN